MDVASLSLKITTDGASEAQSKMDGVTKSAAVLEAQTDKLTASTTRLGPASRMTGEEMDSLKASYERLRIRQDAFLQSLDKQAATLGKGAAAMRAYQAEQLGLTDDKVFQRLNQQVTDLEENSTAGADKMGRMMENMVLRMGLHMAIFISVMKAVSWAYDEVVHGAEKWMDQANKMAQTDAKNALSVSTMAMEIRSNADAYSSGTNAVNGYNGMLERESVLRAEMMAMGPEYRNAIYQENGHYSDQLTLLKQITAEKLKQVNAQIEMVEGTKPSGSPLVGIGAGMSGAIPGLGGMLMSSGARDDIDQQIKYEENLNKLYKARADLMKSIATLNGDYQKGAESLAAVYEINHRIYQSDKINSLGAGKSVSDSILAPKQAKDTFNFKPIQSGTEAALKALQAANKAGETWAIVGQTVVETSSYASDALTRWMDNLDGLGRSWTTLGDTVRNVLADMVRQMERAIIEQKLMQPFFQWAGVAMGGLSFGGATPATSSGLGGVGNIGSGAVTGLAYAGASASAAPQASVVVHVHSNGDVSTDAKTAAGIDLARRIARGEIHAWAQEQMRPNGVLAGNR